MNKYDATRVCPKCGGDDLSDRWEKAHSYKYPENPVDYEHIHRHCRRCHYEWVELPLDAKEQAT